MYRAVICEVVPGTVAFQTLILCVSGQKTLTPGTAPQTSLRKPSHRALLHRAVPGTPPYRALLCGAVPGTRVFWDCSVEPCPV
jgi:hypothetical protein